MGGLEAPSHLVSYFGSIFKHWVKKSFASFEIPSGSIGGLLSFAIWNNTANVLFSFRP